MMIPADRVAYYETPNTFLGNEVLSRLIEVGLEATTDAAEAGNCYATGRYTACIFHLMRLMEKCVQKMGNDLGIPEKITCEKEWQKILNDMKGKIKEKYPSEKDSERIKLESVIGHLETVKIAWRNPTMHPKATYTAREAENIINAVRIFLEDFSLIII